jgi:hypothetical protein
MVGLKRHVARGLLFAVTVIGSGAMSQAAKTEEAVPMVTIERYMAENRMSQSTGEFVAMRCSALFLAMGQAIPANDKQLAKSLDNINLAAARFLLKAQALEAQIRRQPVADPEAGPVFDQVKRMVKAYAERLMEAKARTGSFFADPVFKSDAGICRALAGK